MRLGTWDNDPGIHMILAPEDVQILRLSTMILAYQDVDPRRLSESEVGDPGQGTWHTGILAPEDSQIVRLGTWDHDSGIPGC